MKRNIRTTNLQVLFEQWLWLQEIIITVTLLNSIFIFSFCSNRELNFEFAKIKNENWNCSQKMVRMIQEKKESLGKECRHRLQLKKRKKYHQFFKGYHKDMNTIFCPITTTSINVCNKNKYDVQTMFRKRSISVRHYPISFLPVVW